MADKNLISQSVANGRIVAAVNGTASTTIPMINGDPLKTTNHANGNSNQKDVHTNEPPPDGGTRAWCVMISAFLCNSIIFGIINTYGTIYVDLHKYLKENGDLEAGSKACESYISYIN